MKKLCVLAFLISGAAAAVKLTENHNPVINKIKMFNKVGWPSNAIYIGVPVTQTKYRNVSALPTRVCEEGFGDNEADFLCRKLGFHDGGTFTTYKNLEERYQPINKEPWNWRRYAGNLTITNCTENATSLADCTHSYTEMSCTIDDSVALKCNPVWELEKVELKRNISSTVVTGSYGTVVVTMKRRSDGLLVSLMAQAAYRLYQEPTESGNTGP